MIANVIESNYLFVYAQGLPYNISVTMALPPDTDTPGFANEEKDKPMETRLISQSAGLFEPEKVANKIMLDALDGKFFSFIGFESFMLTTLCGGMAPSASLLDLVYEVLFLSVFKIVGQIYLKSFHRIIRKCMKEKDSMKKNE
ncbi:hypothetical protein J437_LFUL002033 [Ladona fulva]|uniref:Uncharacterized protein n=1 Tax=Ladona fulva TaxID=123851 RepID=A0A8K0NSI9_LADFU|nr:hypothetical protein J437_LFUL002033 [Ladona fulva]